MKRCLDASPRGMNVRAAVRVALEGLAGDLIEWAHLNRDDLRKHVCWYVGSFALTHGIILEPEEILVELDEELIARDIIRKEIGQ